MTTNEDKKDLVAYNQAMDEHKKNPVVYSRHVTWSDGRQTDQANCERPYFLLDENNHPTHLFLATGEGPAPYQFSRTWNMVIPLR